MICIFVAIMYYIHIASLMLLCVHVEANVKHIASFSAARPLGVVALPSVFGGVFMLRPLCYVFPSSLFLWLCVHTRCQQSRLL